MLFMGTQKYPNEAEYNDYISKNSGQTNAFTDKMNTVFIFDVANTAFEEALDRFSQFFISPLFDQNCTDREMKAVDSEYNLNIQQDCWRKS
jgi:insulysin